MELKNKVAVVTGSTSGIGLGIAKALAVAGAKVVLNGLGSAEDNAEAIAHVRESCAEADFSPANMLEPAQISQMIEDAEAKFGQVDILVNNAGIQHVSPIDQFPAEKWDAIIAINLSSSFHTMQAVIPGMKKRPKTKISRRLMTIRQQLETNVSAMRAMKMGRSLKSSRTIRRNKP